MTDINVSVDNKRLLTSNYLLLKTNKFKINVDNLLINVEFIEKEEVKGTRLEGSSNEEGTILNLQLVNYKKKPARGFLEPVVIGDLDGKDLSLSYWITTINEETDARLMAFNLFLEEE